MELQEIIRNEQNQITVPVITFKKGDRQVVIIGMLHVATKEFFEDVLSRLNKYEDAGFQVLYEEVEKIPSTEKSKLDLLFNGLGKYNIYRQLDFLVPRTTWKSADIGDLVQDEDVESNFDNDSIQKESGNDEYMINPEKYIKEILLPQLIKPSLDIPGFEVMINKRNQEAVRAIISYAETTNIVTFWGCSHLPGMIKILEQAGFQIDKTEWISAINIEKLKTI